MIKFSFLIAVYLLASQGLPPSNSQIYKALPAAHKAWIDGNPRLAIAEFSKLKRTDQNLYNLSFLHFHLGENATALKYLTECLELNDEYTDAFYLRALIYEKREFFEEAIKSVKLALDERDDAIFYLKLATLYDRVGKREDAIENYKEAVSEDMSLMKAHVQIAKDISKKNVKDAISYLKEALYQQFPSENYYIFLGDLYLADNNTAKSIESYKNYLEYYPYGQYAAAAKTKLENLGFKETLPIFDPNVLTQNFKLRTGEYLKYDVSYGINVGEMEISVAPDFSTYQGRETIKVDYRLKSNTFLVTLDAFFEAYLNTNNLNTEISYFSRNVGEEINEQKIYIFDRQNRKFICRTVLAGGRLYYIEKELPINTQDGTAILYYTRGLVANKLNQTVTTIISEEFKRTDIKQAKKMEKEEIFNAETAFHYIKAKAHYQGLAGMTGDAEGYFLQGNYAPAIGKMEIIIGKIRVELIQMK
jgi:tetratricopeptide (TPR) repeat protein